MNFLPATVSGSTLETPFGPIELDAARAEKITGRDLVLVGIRPEYFEDASLVDEAKKHVGSTFTAKVDVTSGWATRSTPTSPTRPRPRWETKLKELSRELDADQLRTQAIVSIDSTNRIREGRDAEFWLDARKIHVFDPESGENLTRDPEAGAELTRLAAEDRAEQVAQARGQG